MKKVHGGRGMLNLPGHQSTASIVAEIENTANWPEGHDKYGREIKERGRWSVVPEILVKVSDCDRAVAFDFAINTPEDRLNSFHKIDMMIESLVAFREGLAIECQRYKQRVKDLPEEFD